MDLWPVSKVMAVAITLNVTYQNSGAWHLAHTYNYRNASVPSTHLSHLLSFGCCAPCLVWQQAVPKLCGSGTASPCSGEPQPAPTSICSPSCLLSVSYTNLLRLATEAVFAALLCLLSPCPLYYPGHSQLLQLPIHDSPALQYPWNPSKHQQAFIHPAPFFYFPAPTLLLLSPVVATAKVKAFAVVFLGLASPVKISFTWLVEQCLR